MPRDGSTSSVDWRRSLVDATPHLPSADEINRFLPDAFPAVVAAGVTCESVGDRSAVARWRFDPESLRPGRYISGPTIFSLADSAMWFAVFRAIGMEAMAVTSEMSIRFLRPAQDGDLMAKAKIHSVGNRRIVATMELWVDHSPHKLVAVAQGSYIRP
jgi:uncharacterized protein (TIGR00369 family)